MPQNFSLQLKSNLMIIEKDMKLTVHNPKSFAQEAPFWIQAKCQGKIDLSILPEQNLKKGQGCHAKEGHTQKSQVLEGHAQSGHASKGHAKEDHAQNGLAQEGSAHLVHTQKGQVPEGYAQEGHAQESHVQKGCAKERHAQNGDAHKGHAKEGHAQNGHTPGLTSFT